MKDVLSTLFQASFQENLIQFQGLILFFLLVFWISLLWKDLLTGLLQANLGVVWAWFALGFGGFYAVGAIDAWGGEFALVAVTLGVGLFLSLFHATIATCFFTTLLFLRPWELLVGEDYFGVLPRLTFGICIGQVLLTRYRDTRLLHWSWSSSLFLAFCAWVFLTTMVSPDPGWAQSVYFESLFKAFFLYLMMTHLLNGKRDFGVLIGTLVITFLGVGLLSIYQTLGMAQFETDLQKVRLTGIGAFSNANDVAALMAFVFPFAWMLLVRKAAYAGQTILTRTFAGVVLAVILVSIHLAQSRGALLGVIASLAVFFGLKLKNKKFLWVLVPALLAILPVFVMLSSRSESDLSESSSSRMIYVKAAIVMGLKNPVFGVGFNGFGTRYGEYASGAITEWGERTAHNSWLLVFSETGFLGLVLFVAIFGAAVRSAWSLRRDYPELLMTLASYGIAMTFLSHSYLIYPYLLYGMIAALRYPTSYRLPM